LSTPGSNPPADRSTESGTDTASANHAAVAAGADKDMGVEKTVAEVPAVKADSIVVAEEPNVRFIEFGFVEPINRAIAEMGYEKPTPIQAAAIPIVMQGKDVMGAAQTGTGKTAGFALPILQRLMRHATTSASPARHPIRALVLAPTRELADQIYENVASYSKYTGLRATAVFGGVDIKPQLAALRQGAEVLIATPGRLLDHVEQRTANLGQVEVLVLDEADRMLDMGFLPDIHRIIRLLPKQRQNLMFSATFSKEIRKLAGTFLNDPQLIEVARRNATAENVEQQIYRVRDTESKRAAVAQLIRDRNLPQVIVFTNTKIGAGRLARILEKQGLNASAIHGDKSQQERLAVLDAFKKNEVRVLVATDVAARGLDIAELPGVINYDLPYSAEDYVHRIGRTGRAGASGLALSIVTHEDERLRVEIEKLIKKPLVPIDLTIDGELKESSRSDADRGRSARSGRSDRNDRPDRKDRSERSSSNNARPRSRPSQAQSKLPGSSTDPFFFQPYNSPVKPAEAAAADTTDSADVGSSMVARRNQDRKGRKAPVAALLGGLKQAS